jgi:hypothetical protein
MTALLTLMLGLVDLGVGVFRNHIVSESARQGARQAIVHGANASVLGSWYSSTPLVYQNISSTTTDPHLTGLLPYLTGLDLSTVTVTYQWPDSTHQNQVESPVEVTVTTTWSPILTSLFGAGPYKLSASSTMPIAH